MQNRSAFEEEWSNSFEDAEKAPSEAVWDKVELALVNSANGSFKKRLLFFKLLTAASVAFALSIGGIAVYKIYFPSAETQMSDASDIIEKDDGSVRPDSPSMIAEENNKLTSEGSDDESKREDKTGTTKEPTANTGSGGETASRFIDASGQGDLAENGSSGSADAPLADTPELVTSDYEGAADPLTIAYNDDPAVLQREMEEKAVTPDRSYASAHREDRLVPHRLERLMAEFDSMTLRERELSMVPWYVYADSRKSKVKNRMWAGIDMGAGSFDPAGDLSSPVVEAQNENVFLQDFEPNRAQTSGEEDGTSFNFGISFGTQLSSRVAYTKRCCIYGSQYFQHFQCSSGIRQIIQGRQ